MIERKKNIPKTIKRLCKKHGIKLTSTKKGKRVKKSLCLLLKQLKRKMNKKHKFKRRSKFGEGEPPVPLEEVNKPLEVTDEKITLKERIKKGAKAAGKAIKSKAKAAGTAIKNNPGKATLAGLAVVGAATLAAASGGLLTGPALAVASAAAQGASKVGMVISGPAGKLAAGAQSAASAAASAAAAGARGAATIASGAGTALQTGLEKVTDLKEISDQAHQSVQMVSQIAGKANSQDQQLLNGVATAGESAVIQTAAVGAAAAAFGNNRSPKRVFNFGSRKTVSKKKAMEIIRKLYRKYCKR